MYVERVQVEFFYTGGLMTLWGNKAQCQVWVTTISVVGIGVNNIDYCHCSWCPTRAWWQVLITKDTKAAHSWITGHGELNLVLVWKPLPTGNFPSFGSSHGDCWGSKTINSLTHLWTLGATIMSVLARYDHWCFSGMNAMGGIDCFLIGFKVQCTIWNSCWLSLTGMSPCECIGHSPYGRTCYYYFAKRTKYQTVLYLSLYS